MTKTRRHVESESYLETRARCELTVREARRARKQKLLDDAELERERRRNLPARLFAASRKHSAKKIPSMPKFDLPEPEEQS